MQPFTLCTYDPSIINIRAFWALYLEYLLGPEHEIRIDWNDQNIRPVRIYGTSSGKLLMTGLLKSGVGGGSAADWVNAENMCRHWLMTEIPGQNVYFFVADTTINIWEITSDATSSPKVVAEFKSILHAAPALKKLLLKCLASVEAT